jgi:phage terminase small subunit
MAFTARQERFIVEYVASGNATRSAIAAGYAEGSAKQQGSYLLSNPDVAAEIERRRGAIEKKVLKKFEVTREWIVEELAKLARSNMADFTSFDEDGNPVLDFTDVDRDKMAAVKEITSETSTVGGAPVRKTKFTLHDKRAALMDLAKLEGHVVDRQQLTGANGGPIATMNAHVITTAELTPERRAALRAALEGMDDET